MGKDIVYGFFPSPILRVAAVHAEPRHVLVVTWTNGETVRVDLSGWIAFHDIRELRDDAVFGRPAIGEFGSCVEWMGNGDLAIDTVHLELLAREQAPFAPAELAVWQQRFGLSDHEAAGLLGVSVDVWPDYRSGATPIPRCIAIACRAMIRNPILFTAVPADAATDARRRLPS